MISHHPVGEEGIEGHKPFHREVMGLSQGHAGANWESLTPSLALCQVQGTARGQRGGPRPAIATAPPAIQLHFHPEAAPSAGTLLPSPSSELK